MERIEKEIKVTMCVPVYNVEIYLQRCLDSLSAQTVCDCIEYLFVDDCSTDESPAVLKNWVDQHPELCVRIIRNERNLGSALSRPVAIRESRGKYLCFCDSDDWVEATMVEKLLNRAENSGCAMAACGFVKELGSGKRKPYMFNKASFGLNDAYCEVAYFSFWNKLIKRDLVLKVVSDEQVKADCWEDLNVVSRVMALCGDVAVVDEPLYHYNLANVGSLTHGNESRILSERMANCDSVCRWFESKGAEFCGVYADFLGRMKFAAKVKLFRQMKFKQWVKTYPESNRDVLRLHKQYPLFWRVVMWTVIKVMGKGIK